MCSPMYVLILVRNQPSFWASLKTTPGTKGSVVLFSVSVELSLASSDELLLSELPSESSTGIT